MSPKMKNSYWLYTSSNRWCFKSLLKISIDPAHLICSGNWFQILGPLQEKDLSAKVEHWVRNSTKRCEDNELERSRLTLDCSWSMSDMYWGVWWRMDLKTRTRILKSMRCLIGSQWSSMRSAVTGSYLRFLVTRRAEVRWMFWSRLRRDSFRPMSKLLQ